VKNNTYLISRSPDFDQGSALAYLWGALKFALLRAGIHASVKYRANEGE
jgi:hypothetical protein